MYTAGKIKPPLLEEDSLIQEVKTHVSSLFEGAVRLMISVFDVERNQFLFCNDAFFNILGYRPDELIGGGWPFWYKLVRPGESIILKKNISQLLQYSQPLNLSADRTLSYHIRDVFKNWLLVSHTLSPCLFNDHFIVVNYMYDITQIERIEFSFGKYNRNSGPNPVQTITVSKREKEVLLLIAEGLSSKQIADVLYISNHTAIKHRKNLIDKFQVKNTAQLIKEASKRTLL